MAEYWTHTHITYTHTIHTQTHKVHTYTQAEGDTKNIYTTSRHTNKVNTHTHKHTHTHTKHTHTKNKYRQNTRYTHN